MCFINGRHNEQLDMDACRQVQGVALARLWILIFKKVYDAMSVQQEIESVRTILKLRAVVKEVYMKRI